MDKVKRKLVDGLTTETKQRAYNYDRHVAMSEHNRHVRQCRIERVKDMVKDFISYVLPYVVAMVLIFSIMSLRG
jgi:hypothetical protein